MKLPRPHIPLAVQLEVALRQLFGNYSEVHLDHHPALCNREVIYDSAGKFIRYIPDANDPDYLIFRGKTDHDIKTRVRGDGAQLSDLALRRKNKRIEKRLNPKKVFTPTRTKYVRHYDK